MLLVSQCNSLILLRVLIINTDITDLYYYQKGAIWLNMICVSFPPKRILLYAFEKTDIVLKDKQHSYIVTTRLIARD